MKAVNVLVGVVVISLALLAGWLGGRLIVDGLPRGAILSGLFIGAYVFCAYVFNATKAIKRAVARIECELAGHWPADFKKKYHDEAYCPRCNELIRTRALGSDGNGMQFCQDTLHQRLSRLEAALGVDHAQYDEAQINEIREKYLGKVENPFFAHKEARKNDEKTDS